MDSKSTLSVWARNDRGTPVCVQKSKQLGECGSLGMFAGDFLSVQGDSLSHEFRLTRYNML
jgi:hypothetical protein